MNNRYYETRKEKLASICREILKEDPLAEDLLEVIDRLDTKKVVDGRVQNIFVRAKKTNCNRTIKSYHISNKYNV